MQVPNPSFGVCVGAHVRQNGRGYSCPTDPDVRQMGCPCPTNANANIRQMGRLAVGIAADSDAFNDVCA